LVEEICIVGLCPRAGFSITVTGNNPQPQRFTLHSGDSQAVTLGPGSFAILMMPLVSPSLLLANIFSGDCMQLGLLQASGTISAGQQLTCTIQSSVDNR
jgi:hypothetical protein